jgi:hypothetical protein
MRLSGSQDEAFSPGVSPANDLNSSKYAAVDGTLGKDRFVRRPRSFPRWCALGMGAIDRRNNVETDVYP